MLYMERVNSQMYHILQMFIIFMLHVICKMVLQNSSLPKCDSLPLGVDAIKRYFNC